MMPMMRNVWIIALALIVATPTVFASEWDKLLNDIELYEDVVDLDASFAEEQMQDIEMESRTELFPADEDEEDSEDVNEVRDTHITIKVDGAPVRLTDVPAFEWFAVYVKDVADRKLISGYRDSQNRPTGEFGPADSVTVEQLAKMASLAAELDTYSCGSDLKNESAVGRWSEGYIRCAEYLKWTIFSEGTIDVTRPATRTDVVVTVLQAFGARISPRSGSVFDDVTTMTPYAAGIETAAEQGIVSGYSDVNGKPTGLFGPLDSVNRAEAAKIFSLGFQVYDN
jgi:hypothetical protein